MSNAVEDNAETMMDINICDLDDTEFTHNMIKFMTSNINSLDGEVNTVEITSDNYAEELKKAGVKNVVIIPQGFTESVEKNEAATVRYVQRLNSLATLSNLNTGSQVAVEYLSAAVKEVVYSTKVANGKLTNSEVTFLNDPIHLEESTVVADKSEDISASIVMSLCSAQGMIVPIMMFVLVMMSSNMILNAVSTEKIDKTLETLLSAPISRLSVIAAKMLSAAVVAAMQAAVYMIGAKNMMNGVLDNVSGESGYSEALKNLGLTMDASQYVLVGLQMFLSILIALSVSLILGVLARDAKSAQTLTLPIMMCTMIPYMLSMFVDIKTMSPAVRYIEYAIHFHLILVGKTDLRIMIAKCDQKRYAVPMYRLCIIVDRLFHFLTLIAGQIGQAVPFDLVAGKHDQIRLLVHNIADDIFQRDVALFFVMVQMRVRKADHLKVGIKPIPGGILLDQRRVSVPLLGKNIVIRILYDQ